MAILLTSVIQADETVTTNNLLDQDFTNWTGNVPTLTDTIHGTNVIAATNNGYMSYIAATGLSDNISNQGFTSVLGADVWAWGSYEQTVKMSQTYSDGTNTITQHRNIIGHCDSSACQSPLYVNYKDTMIVGANTLTAGTIKVEFDFNDSSQAQSGHTGVDLEHPTLNITYAMPSAVVLPPVFIETPVVIEIEPIATEIEPIIVLPPVVTVTTPKPIIEEQPIEEPKEEIVMVEEPSEPINETVERETEEVGVPVPEESPEKESIEEVKEKVEVKTAVKKVVVNKPIINPVIVSLNINTQAMLEDQPDLSSYKTVNQELFKTAKLPTGNLNFFNEIKLPGYDRAIYRSRETILTMLLNDPIIQYEIKLEQAKTVTDRAYKKLMEAISARNNI